MTTWTTIYYEKVEGVETEFQGPKIKAKHEQDAKLKALISGVILSDKYTKPPLLIRLKIFVKKGFKS